MGFFKNVNNGWKMKQALLPLAAADSEAQFRALLPAAKSMGEQVWPSGQRRLVMQGSAKDAVLSAAAAPLAAENLLAAGQFFAAQQLVITAIQNIDQMYG